MVLQKPRTLGEGRRSKLSTFLRILFLPPLAVAPSSAAIAQSVAADGSTATGVTIGSSGLITVDIAPANSASISHNRYSSFSVPEAGVNLDNRAVSARTILNEVTSANVTTIEGPLSVIGPSADVIVANPNGIVVNGGRFQNTGNVALTTGVLGGVSDGLVTSTVTAGRIDIGPNGLSGTMEELALVSKSLRVDGPLRFDILEEGSHANIITGEGTINFDRLRSGAGIDGAGILPWALSIARSGVATDAVTVDITGNGSLSAGRISVTVNDQGAGVRIAGDQLASAGEFRLSSTGRLEIDGSAVAAQDSVVVSAASVDLVSSGDGHTGITSETGGVLIRAKTGDISLGQSRIAGTTIASSSLDSEGGVTLLAEGDITSSGSSEHRTQLISDTGEQPVSQNTSSVVLKADGGIHLENLDVSADGDFRLDARNGVSFSAVAGSADGNFQASSVDAGISFDATNLTSQSGIALRGTELRFGADDAEQERTELKAENGGFVARSIAGNILNFGSLLQGDTANAADPESLGGVSIYSAGSFLNRSLSVDRLAVAFGQADDLHIETGGDVSNETGRLFSNAAINIVAGGDILNETNFTAASSPLSIQRINGSRFAGSFFLKRSSSTFVQGDFGEQAIPGEQSFILGIGDVNLSAQNIRSVGADISGANVTLAAAERFQNEARQIGQVSFRQRCKWFCKTSGSSSLRLTGGTVTASASLELSAGVSVINLAGSLSGASGVEIAAPETVFVPAFSPNLIEHPAGLTGLFSGRRGYFAPSYLYGSIQSFGGDITINGNADLGEANLFTFGDVVVTGTRIQSARPTIPVLFERRPIGLAWSIFD